MKKGKIPDVIICMGCKRRLLLKDYMGIHPSENTPPDHIHNTYNQNIPHYSAMCTCGHFMINVPRNSASVRT